MRLFKIILNPCHELVSAVRDYLLCKQAHSADADTDDGLLLTAVLPDKDAVEEGHKAGVEMVHDDPRPGAHRWVRGQERWVLL